MNDVDLTRLRVARSAAEAPRRRGFRFRWWHGLLLLAAAGGGWFTLNPPATRVRTTQAVMAHPSQQYVILNATGYVVARRKAAVASKGTGRVEWLGVVEGSHVKEGELIARLESRDVEATLQNAIANTGVAAASVQSAKVDLTIAEAQYQRSVDLFKKRFISRMDMENVESRYLRAKAAVSSAQASLQAAMANENYARNEVAYTRITAPFDGVIISRSANVGDIVTPLSSAADSKGAVAILADLSTLEVDADVSESSLASIQVGQPCEIIFDALPEKRYSGVVSTIVPAVNRSSATVTTKVRIIDPDSTILPDMSAKVSFLSQAVDTRNERPRLAVHPDAIVQRGAQKVVYRVEADSRVRQVSVTPGPMLGEVRAIDVAQGSGSALKPGDAVVLKPGAELGDASPVAVAQDQ